MSGIAQAGEHHQVDVAAGGLAPFAEFSCEGAVLLGQRLGLKILEALVHQIEGVVDQLGSLFGGHGTAGEGRSSGVAVL